MKVWFHRFVVMKGCPWVAIECEFGSNNFELLSEVYDFGSSNPTLPYGEICNVGSNNSELLSEVYDFGSNQPGEGV